MLEELHHLAELVNYMLQELHHPEYTQSARCARETGLSLLVDVDNCMHGAFIQCMRFSVCVLRAGAMSAQRVYQYCSGREL